MAYATQDDLVPLRLSASDLVELTSDSDDVDTDVVTAALDEASATVDAYCGQRYKTPLQPSGLVKKITIDLAIYALATRRRDVQPKDSWTLGRDQAMSFLRDVSSGKASLDLPESAAPQTSSNDVTTPSQRQTFDDCNLRGFC